MGFTPRSSRRAVNVLNCQGSMGHKTRKNKSTYETVYACVYYVCVVPMEARRAIK